MPPVTKAGRLFAAALRREQEADRLLQEAVAAREAATGPFPVEGEAT
jgi:hypothetical protein